MPAPINHSTAAHLLLGWCKACPGQTLIAEVRAWRAWATVNVPEVRETDRPLPPVDR